MKKRTNHRFIKVDISTLKGLKKAEWYKARHEKYVMHELNRITNILTFRVL